MKNGASLLLGTLLTLATGCHATSMAPPAAHVLAPQTTSASASTAAEMLEGLEPNRLAEIAVPVKEAEAKVATCRLGEGRGENGFYATDARTAGEVVLTFDDGPHPKGTPRV